MCIVGIYKCFCRALLMSTGTSTGTHCAPWRPQSHKFYLHTVHSERFKPQTKPFYVRNSEALENGEKYFDILNNHKTSNQNETVIERLGVILKNGNYRKAQPELEKLNLSTNKRNYNVLKPDGPSPVHALGSGARARTMMDSSGCRIKGHRL